jgi:hypothetical protein
MTSRRIIAALTLGSLAVAIWLALSAGAPTDPCELEPRYRCFGLQSLEASLSTYEAGAHPDVSFGFEVREDPESKPNVFGLHDAYVATRNMRIELPPGLVGNPNVLGEGQQCMAAELLAFNKGGNCPNGSQIGISTVWVYGQGVDNVFREPVYMMVPPGGDVVARLGFIAAVIPVFIDLRVRSEGDYGLVADITDASAEAHLIRAETTTWGVPADPVHDTERCTPNEAFEKLCISTVPRPPGGRVLPFLTNPTHCGEPLSLSVNASSWIEPELIAARKLTTTFPEPIEGCDKLPYGPGLEAQTISRHTSTPTGLGMTIRLPASDVKVLEPAQTRDIRIDLPEGLTVNPGAAEGLGVCSVAQVHFGERVAAECPDSAKMASTEFDVSALPRRMKGAIYLREPEPGNLFRVWVVADDLGAHVKLAGQLEVDKVTGQIRSVVLNNPQVPLREAVLRFKSGFRAPLMTPHVCDADPSTPERDPYFTHYEFTPWSGGLAAVGDAPMQISEGCGERGFSPKLAAGSTEARAGAFSPFAFTISREDPEENLAGLDVTLPRGMAASFAGIQRCEGLDAESGHCPAASRIGRTVVADGAGPNPLWVPQPGKDPTAIYLSGPYKGAPFSIVAVVPAQAGPFDLGLEVVRSAVYVDPVTAQATAKADPLPQIIEGIPITYKTVNVLLDRPHFSLNPTSCARKEVRADLTSDGGRTASPSASFAASDCAALAFKPKLSFRLRGGTHRGAHPRLTTVFHPRPGDANVGSFSVALPHSEFLDQAHIKTVCTRVQFKADQCPAASIYGQVSARSPLFDFPLEGPIYLRSSSNPLPDMVAALHGPPSFPIEVEAAGRIDSVNGGIRATFESLPDAPISAIVARFPGGGKGLIVNSTNLCQGEHRVTAKFTAQNGKRRTLHPLLRSSCKKAAREPKR